MLHVTNGDAAARLIAGSGIGGEVLPWRDVLHEGPVPGGVEGAALNVVRARFIADRGWGDYSTVLADLHARDARLARAAVAEEIVLWFEHDLYDQLQLIQVLSALDGARGNVSLICIDRHPAVERFTGLGQLNEPQLAELFPTRGAVTVSQRELAHRAWAAFRSPDPADVEPFAAQEGAALTFLPRALHRHLEQFPATGTGLTRSEFQILEVVSARVSRLDRIFQATQDLEDAPYLGDLSAWACFAELASGERPLIRAVDGAPIGHPGEKAEREREVELTRWGRSVLRREVDSIALRGGIDRWYGGAHLMGAEPAWRWDATRSRLTPLSDT